MITINFYKLFSLANLVPSVAMICNKILETEEKSILFFNNKDEMSIIDEKLWTFSQSEFIPHTVEGGEDWDENDEFLLEETPILLTTSTTNIIKAQNIMIFNPSVNIDFIKKFNKIFVMFSGENEAMLTEVRALWKQVSAEKQTFTAKFYEQGEAGKWQLKL